MLFSFFVFPFYSGVRTLRELFSARRPFLDTSMMEDYFYVVTFTMLFGRQIVLLIGITGWILGTFFAKKFFQNPLLSLSAGFLCFIIAYWLSSFFVYLIQTLAYMSTNIRKVLITLDKQQREKEKEKEDISEKIVH